MTEDQREDLTSDRLRIRDNKTLIIRMFAPLLVSHPLHLLGHFYKRQLYHHQAHSNEQGREKKTITKKLFSNYSQWGVLVTITTMVINFQQVHAKGYFHFHVGAAVPNLEFVQVTRSGVGENFTDGWRFWRIRVLFFKIASRPLHLIILFMNSGIYFSKKKNYA